MARILVVDDSESMLVSLEWMLQGAGHEVWTASSGTQALEVLLDLRRGPDLNPSPK